jgi:Outer membrane protein beta-barrel domain
MGGWKMFKALACLGLVCWLPLAARAQDAPQVEVFAGYSYLRAHDSLSEGLNQSGWEGSIAYDFTRSLGVVADLSNHYGTNAQVFSPLGTTGKGFTFLFGPQYTFRKSSRLAPFAHALFGGMRVSQLVPDTFISVTSGLVPGPGCTTILCYGPKTVFAMAFGGGLDVKATNHVWIRVFQADYLRANLTNANGTSAAQNDFRASAGIVFRFGRR